MTFTHQMARLILFEQLYRAVKLIIMSHTIYKKFKVYLRSLIKLFKI